MRNAQCTQDQIMKSLSVRGLIVDLRQLSPLMVSVKIVGMVKMFLQMGLNVFKIMSVDLEIEDWKMGSVILANHTL